MYIEVKDACKRFVQDGKEFVALDHVSLDIEKGEFICLLGPSGCGKSTLLNALAGFDRVNSGSVKIDGKEVTEPSINNITIFQNYGLLPWRNVLKNVELGLESKKIPKEERARGLAVDPDIIFMDEPFGALDAITRMKLQEDILRISREEKKTIIFVTHDIEEAVFLADRIVVMMANPGRIKSVVKVPLGSHRDRTAEDFFYVRDKIFELFNMKADTYIEYYI